MPTRAAFAVLAEFFLLQHPEGLAGEGAPQTPLLIPPRVLRVCHLLPRVQDVRQFLLPLVAEVRRTEDGDAANFAPGQEFARDEQRLNGLAHAHVVGDEEADGVEAEGHEEGDELVGARADGDAPQGAEGAGTVPQGEASGVSEEFGGEGVGGVVGGRERELRGLQLLHAPLDQGEVDPAKLGLTAGEGA